MTLPTACFIACLGFTAGLAAAGWARLMERFADDVCTCRKHAWNPTCPRHGRKESA